MQADPTPRLQFRVRHLLLLTAATAVTLGVYRWLYTQKLPYDAYTPLAVWAGSALITLTAMGWIVVNAGRRFEISRLRVASLIIGVGPIGFWIAGFAKIALRPAGGEAPYLVQLALTIWMVAAAISMPCVLLAVIVNLWRQTDRLLLAVQLMILALAIVGFGASMETRLMR
jgi:hypothetical protein